MINADKLNVIYNQNNLLIFDGFGHLLLEDVDYDLINNGKRILVELKGKYVGILNIKAKKEMKKLTVKEYLKYLFS